MTDCPTWTSPSRWRSAASTSTRPRCSIRYSTPQGPGAFAPAPGGHDVVHRRGVCQHRWCPLLRLPGARRVGPGARHLRRPDPRHRGGGLPAGPGRRAAGEWPVVPGRRRSRRSSATTSTSGDAIGRCAASRPCAARRRSAPATASRGICAVASTGSGSSWRPAHPTGYDRVAARPRPLPVLATRRHHRNPIRPAPAVLRP